MTESFSQFSSLIHTIYPLMPFSDKIWKLCGFFFTGISVEILYSPFCAYAHTSGTVAMHSSGKVLTSKRGAGWSLYK